MGVLGRNEVGALVRNGGGRVWSVMAALVYTGSELDRTSISRGISSRWEEQQFHCKDSSGSLHPSM